MAIDHLIFAGTKFAADYPRKATLLTSIPVPDINYAALPLVYSGIEVNVVGYIPQISSAIDVAFDISTRIPNGYIIELPPNKSYLEYAVVKEDGIRFK